MNDPSVSPFDCDSDSSLYEYKILLDKLLEGLSDFGLTKNQSKVFFHLGKHGPQTAPNVSKSLRLPRTETYQLLKTLQKKGISSAIFDHPVRYAALPFGTAMQVLLNSERERIRGLEKKQAQLEEIWDELPDLSMDPLEAKEDRLQMLQGQNPIIGKITNMYENAEKEFLILGSERDYLRFYHSDFFDSMNNSKVDLKILTSCSENTMYVFDEIDPTRCQRIPQKATKNLCFLIKDNNEVIFFIKQDNPKSNDLLAVWTDSISIISSLKQLFGLLWSEKSIRAESKKSIYNKATDDEDFKFKELEQEKLIVKEINNHLIEMLSKNDRAKLFASFK